MNTEKLIEKRRQKASKLKNPTPVELPSGKWRCQVTVHGKRVGVVEDDPEIAHAKALAIKSDLIQVTEKKSVILLDDAILEHMEAGSNLLSPATLRGYDCMRRNRFRSIMNRDIHSLTRLDIQKAVNEEAKTLSPKTVINAYGLLMTVLKNYGISFTGVKLPQRIKKKKEYLSAGDIAKLIDASVGDSCEIAIIMAVWLGMRRSEIMGLCWDCVDFEKSTVEIRRAMVPDKENKWVIKEGAKNESSQRIIKCPSYIMDKLSEIYHGQTGRVFLGSPDTLRRHVHKICEKAGITDTTVHGLRHANAAVMVALNIVDKYAMARNGWTSDYTFKQIYSYVFPEGAAEADELINNFFEGMIAHENAHEK